MSRISNSSGLLGAIPVRRWTDELRSAAFPIDRGRVCRILFQLQFKVVGSDSILWPILKGRRQKGALISEIISLHFQSSLEESQVVIWDGISSLKGIAQEQWPFIRMTVPPRFRDLRLEEMTTGKRLFRSYILLLGLWPLDFSDLTLLQVRELEGFTEQSPMGSMKFWRHERTLEPDPFHSGRVLLIDRLSFEPRFFSSMVTWFVRIFFEHRHRKLRARFKGKDFLVR